jgi:hypothetical protein
MPRGAEFRAFEHNEQAGCSRLAKAIQIQPE